MRQNLSWIVLSAAGLLASQVARAGQGDLARQIDAQRAGVVDLERLDVRRAVPDETTSLRSWLDEASAQYAREEFDRVRELLDRCIAQAELIRQKIVAVDLVAQAEEREAAVKTLRDKTESARQSLQQALIKKKALEMTTK